MKRIVSFFVLYLICVSTHAYVGQEFSYEGIRYCVTNEGTPVNAYRVSVSHYDTAYVVIPDSVPCNGRKYQVAQTAPFLPANCALQHYIKVDYSLVQCDFTSVSQDFSADVEVDTLILPPFSGHINVGHLSIPNECDTMMQGIRHIALSGTTPVFFCIAGDDFRFSIRSIDLSACPYTNIEDAFKHHLYHGFNLADFPHLETVRLPQTITFFPRGLTAGSRSLQYITIPDSLEKIEIDVFGDIAKDYIRLGKKVKTIGPGWASAWRALQYIEVDGENPYYSSDEQGNLLSKGRNILYRYPVGRPEEEYELPDEIDTIGIAAFATEPCGQLINQCTSPYGEWQQLAPLRKVTLHSNVRQIQFMAFCFASIRQIGAIEGSDKESDFSISAVEDIQRDAFNNSLLEDIHLPASLRYLGSRYMLDKSLGDYDFFTFFKEIDASPNDLRKDEWYHTGCTFYRCTELRSVDFSKADNLEYMGQGCFAYCPRLQHLDLLPCVKLRDVPPGICYLDSALTYVALPHEVEYIGYSAFYGCTSLQKIVCPAAIPILIDPPVFEGVNKQTCELSVPAASIPLYKNAPVWRDFFNITSNGLTAIIVTSNDTIMGTVHGGGGYDPGVTSTISATAKEGCEFVGWSDGNTDNPRVVQVTRDSNIVAIFQPIEYFIDARPNDTTLGTVTGGGYYHFHDTVILAANIPGNSRFTGWSDGYRYPIRDLVVTQDCTLIANFEHYHVGPNTVRVTVQSEDPAKGYAIGGGTYDLGDTASVAGIANAGYVFKGWDDGNINNPRHVPLTQDTLFVALFRLETDTTDTMVTPRYPLKAIPYDSTMGTVSGSGRYEEGTVVEITATPFDGYRIKGWNVEVTVSPTITFTMSDRPATVIAYFEPVDDALPMTPADPADPDPDHTPYNILGQPVDETYHGIVIQNGKKRVQ